MHTTAVDLGLAPPQPAQVGPDLARRAGGLLVDAIEQARTPHGFDLADVVALGQLTGSDHLASAQKHWYSHIALDPDTIPELLAQAGHTPRPHQTGAWQADSHLDLRAPTGTGKTEAGLGWAAHQLLARPGQPRLIWTLPYLAPLDAMRHRLHRDLALDSDEIAALHSKSPERLLADALGPGRTGQDTAAVVAARKALARDSTARLLAHRLRVATPYQVMFGMLGGAQRAPLLADAANSVLVFDELHAYEPTRLGYLLACMRLWERLGSAIGVVSATIPERLRQLVADTFQQAPTRVDAVGTAAIRRHTWQLEDRGLNDPAVLDGIAAAAASVPVLVVANTVDRARQTAVGLQDRGATTTLLHSRFTAADRNRIEIQARQQWATGRTKRPAGVLVATQVVEVSLDVDFDVAWSELAPLDALIQRVGRVNRTGSRPAAPVTVCIPPRRRDGSLQVAPFYPPGNVEHTLELIHRLAGQQHTSEADLADAVDALYTGPWGDTWYEQVTKARDRFATWTLNDPTPLLDSSHLARQFEELFDGGAEAVPAELLDTYRNEVATAPGRAGRLLAARWLVPLPTWAVADELATWHDELRIHIAHTPYDPHAGLDLQTQPPTRSRPGDTIL